jgi:hypothetical protein
MINMVHKYYETKLEAMMLNNSTNRNEIASQTVEHKGKNRYTDRYIISLLLVPSSSAIHCEQHYDCWFILKKIFDRLTCVYDN